MSTRKNIVLFAALAVLGGCNGGAPENSCTDCGAISNEGQPLQPPEGTAMARSSLERAVAPEVPEADRESLSSSSTAFALDLYRLARQASDDNLVFSPHSIQVALTMTWAGTAGASERQLADVLHFELPEAQVHAALNQLDATLAEAHQAPVNLRIVNATWAQRDYEFLPSYLDVLALNYGAGMYLADFTGATEESRTIINDWVSDQTASRIEELLPAGVLTPLTRLVLTNAVYFKAPWLYEFNPEQTLDGQFVRADGTSVTTPIMKLKAELPYAEDATYQAVELPYAGDVLSMVAVLPREGAAQPDLSLQPSELQSLVGALAEQEITVQLPRFSFECPMDVKAQLRELGVLDLFLPGEADLSRMDGTRDLYVQDILHRAFIEVTEAGTEAAAATAVVVGVRSAALPLTVAFDRPFLFLVRHRPTGAILFLGYVADPTA